MSQEAGLCILYGKLYGYQSLTGNQAAILFEKYGVFDYIHGFYVILHTTDISISTTTLIFI